MLSSHISDSKKKVVNQVFLLLFLFTFWFYFFNTFFFKVFYNFFSEDGHTVLLSQWQISDGDQSDTGTSLEPLVHNPESGDRECEDAEWHERQCC